jgi:hypothetical protein
MEQLDLFDKVPDVSKMTLQELCAVLWKASIEEGYEIIEQMTPEQHAALAEVRRLGAEPPGLPLPPLHRSKQ